MKRLSLLIGFACLTFAVGVGLTLGYLRIFQPLLIDLASVPSNQLALPSKHPPAEAVKIIVKRSFRGERNLMAEFEVVNGSDETLYYRGYSDDDNQLYSIMRGNRSKRYSPFCGTGLDERILLPGRSVTFKAPVGQETGNIKVGFDFYIGEEKGRQTIWSDDVYIAEP